jgi:metal-sulfur cluster biosynthetic enzyme
MHDELVREVWSALDHVVDPCSRFNGSYLSFVALGMVDAVEVMDDGVARIRLLLDDPTCLYLVEIHKDLREAVLAVEGITSVELSVRSDELWTNELLSPAAHARLGGRQPAGRRLPIVISGAA